MTNHSPTNTHPTLVTQPGLLFPTPHYNRNRCVSHRHHVSSETRAAQRSDPQPRPEKMLTPSLSTLRGRGPRSTARAREDPATLFHDHHWVRCLKLVVSILDTVFSTVRGQLVADATPSDDRVTTCVKDTSPHWTGCAAHHANETAMPRIGDAQKIHHCNSEASTRRGKRRQTRKDEFNIGRQDTCNEHCGITRPRSQTSRSRRREPSLTGRVGKVTEKSCETCSGQYVPERSHIEQTVKWKCEGHETSVDEENDADPPAQSTL